MQVKEAIILAGGLGTRLREAVPDLPKCMAPVAGRPFVSYVIDHLRMQGIQHFIFSLGYKAEAIQQYLEEYYPTLEYNSVIEDEPLGTGGAIQLSLQKAGTAHVLIANGDTLFRIRAKEILQLHQSTNAACTLSLKRLQNFSRYGVVELNAKSQVISFKEKQFYEAGLINGGVYLLDKEKFCQRSFPEKFSFEKDYLEALYKEGQFYGCPQQGYFIDIGIPEDYTKAQHDLKNTLLDLKQVDKNWTLFLDRDGVINNETPGAYVLNWNQFIFSEGVLNAIQQMTEQFGRTLIISNQRGVGKQLMSQGDLLYIHKEMQKEITATGGKIDQIYFCTEVDDRCFYRKPNPGMTLQALADFPDIDLTKSIMVGDKLSDMRFGRSSGMHTVFLTTTNPQQQFPHPDIDLIFNSLPEFAQALKS